MHKLNEGHCFLCIVHAPGVSGLDFDWFALHMIYDKSCMRFCILQTWIRKYQRDNDTSKAN